EDGIRDGHVTGVQTCALPISYAEAIVDTVGRPVLILDHRLRVERANRTYYELFRTTPAQTEGRVFYELDAPWDVTDLRRRLDNRSEERRVGKECRAWWWAYR